MWIRSEQLEPLGNKVGGPEGPEALQLFLSLLLPRRIAGLVAVLCLLPGNGHVTVSIPVNSLFIYTGLKPPYLSLISGPFSIQKELIWRNWK